MKNVTYVTDGITDHAYLARGVCATSSAPRVKEWDRQMTTGDLDPETLLHAADLLGAINETRYDADLLHPDTSAELESTLAQAEVVLRRAAVECLHNRPGRVKAS